MEVGGSPKGNPSEESSWAYNFIYKIVKIFVIFASLFNLILDKKKELINDHEEEKALKERD